VFALVAFIVLVVLLLIAGEIEVRQQRRYRDRQDRAAEVFGQQFTWRPQTNVVAMSLGSQARYKRL
jgi:hypothetical protein